MTKADPYSVSNQVVEQSDQDGDRSSTFLPASIARRTRRIVLCFALFNIAWPLLASLLTDRISIDLISVGLAARSTTVGRTSFRSFPWSVLVCLSYPAIFLMNVQAESISNLAAWLPERDSPVLGMQLASALFGFFAAGCIWKCYRHHKMATRT